MSKERPKVAPGGARRARRVAAGIGSAGGSHSSSLLYSRAKLSVTALALLIICGFRGMGSPGLAAEATNAPARRDYDAFRIISDRNIFNPHRYARSSGRSERPRSYTRTDSFALVGTMSFDKGLFAFFDGSSPDYRKVLKQDEVIAGFKVADIQPSYVKLSTPTNEVELRVGMQLSHTDNQWRVAARAETAEPSSTASSSGSNSRPGAGASAVRPAASAVSNPPQAAAVGDNGFVDPPIETGAPPALVEGEPSAPSTNVETTPPATGSETDVLERLRRRAAAERGENP